MLAGEAVDVQVVAKQRGRRQACYSCRPVSAMPSFALGLISFLFFQLGNINAFVLPYWVSSFMDRGHFRPHAVVQEEDRRAISRVKPTSSNLASRFLNASPPNEIHDSILDADMDFFAVVSAKSTGRFPENGTTPTPSVPLNLVTETVSWLSDMWYGMVSKKTRAASRLRIVGEGIGLGPKNETRSTRTGPQAGWGGNEGTESISGPGHEQTGGPMGQNKAKEKGNEAASLRRGSAGGGVKKTMKAFADGWSVSAGAWAARAKASGVGAWSGLRSKVSTLYPKSMERIGARMKKKRKGAAGRGRPGSARSPREQMAEQRRKRQAGKPADSGARSGVNLKSFSLPSLLQRIDPSAYSAGVWRQTVFPGRGERGRPGREEGPDGVDLEPPSGRPPVFDDLVEFPRGPAEAWDLFVGDARHLADSIYRLLAPAAALPKAGPSRPQVGARPKAARVKQGPLYATPLVLRQKKAKAAVAASASTAWPQMSGPGGEGDTEREKMELEALDRANHGVDMEKEKQGDAESEVWQGLRGRVREMIEESAGAPSGAEYYAMEGAGSEPREQETVAGRFTPSSRPGEERQERRSSRARNLPVPLRAPRLVDRLDEWPRGIAAAGSSLPVTPAAASETFSDERIMDARVPLPPFPSRPPMEDEYWPVPASSAFHASSAFDEEEEMGEGRAEEDGEDWDDTAVAPWRRGLPEWLKRVSLTRLLVRKPTPERMLEVIRRRQQVRRMPRKMDDAFLRTVSRKLQGNRLRIRSFQLQTDRYRNSLLSAGAYVDAVVSLFGSAKEAEEVLLPLTRWLPEASKRRGLSDEYWARRRARLGGLQTVESRQGGEGSATGGTRALLKEAGRVGLTASTAWMARMTAAVSERMVGLTRGLEELGRALGSITCGKNTLIELSFEGGKEEEEAKDGKSMSVDNPTVLALTELERELKGRGQDGGNGGGDDPMARIEDILGDRNAAYFQQRLDLYMRGGLSGMDLYRALKRLCLANEMRLDLVMRQLREESLRGDERWQSQNERLGALLRIHEGQRKIIW